MFQTEEVELLKIKLKVLSISFIHFREEDSEEVGEEVKIEK